MTRQEYWRIPLRNHTGEIVAEALVDDSDYEAVSSFRWSRSADGYAVRKEPGRSGLISMHRHLMGLEKYDPRQVDHVNRDRLDNRRANLRIADPVANAENRGSLPGSSSRHRGVHAGKNGAWIAQARDGKYLGSFGLEIDAAAAAAQHRHRNYPGTIEDPVLLDRVPGSRIKQPRLTPTEVFFMRWAFQLTSLSLAEVADMAQQPNRDKAWSAVKPTQYKKISNARPVTWTFPA